MTVLQAAIFAINGEPTSHKIKEDAHKLDYPVLFNPEEDFSAKDGCIELSLDGQPAGFEFWRSLSKTEDAGNEEANEEEKFSHYGDIVWMTGSKGDFTQLLATLYTLRAALTSHRGTYWDGEEFYSHEEALAILDKVITETIEDIKNPQPERYTQYKKSPYELPRYTRIVLGIILGLILAFILNR